MIDAAAVVQPPARPCCDGQGRSSPAEGWGDGEEAGELEAASEMMRGRAKGRNEESRGCAMRDRAAGGREIIVGEELPLKMKAEEP